MFIAVDYTLAERQAVDLQDNMDLSVLGELVVTIGTTREKQMHRLQWEYTD